MIHAAKLVLAAFVGVGLASCGGSVGDVTLTVNPECANAGVVESGGSNYYVIGPAPAEWRDLGTVSGRLLDKDDIGAVFEADGHVLVMSKDFYDAECLPWPAE